MKNNINLPGLQSIGKRQVPLALIVLTMVLLASLVLGLAIGHYNPEYGIAAAGALLMVVLVLLRLDALSVTLIIAVHLFVDWYLGLHLAGILMALALLFACYLGRSEEHPWVRPRAPWLWLLFLALTIYPAIDGGKLLLYDLSTYYPSDILGALLFFWLGSILARNINAVRLAFQLLAALGTFMALHTIIQSTTGTFLFASSRVDTYLVEVSNYDILGTNAFRSGSFFFDPNWNGAFLAMMFFLPLGLFMHSKTLIGRVVYLAEMAIFVPALLFTYSNGAWIALLGGVLAYILWVGRNSYRLFFIVVAAAAATLVLSLFSTQLAIQLQHAAGADELSLRLGAWETGIRVIEAFPLFGVGLGNQAYLIRSQPYRVPAEIVPLSHPHDAYIEWGAMAGVPVLIIFVLLLLAALWFAWRNWQQTDIDARPLLAGGIAAVIALSINSISINGWTLPPLSDCGWLIAGLISSSLLDQYLRPRAAVPAGKKVDQTDMHTSMQILAEKTL